MGRWIGPDGGEEAEREARGREARGREAIEREDSSVEDGGTRPLEVSSVDGGTGAQGAASGGARARRRVRRPLGETDEVPAGRVSGINERRNGSARYVVAVDGRPVATASAAIIAELGIEVGAILDEAAAARLRSAASQLAVFDKAVELLAVRARSTRELQLRLRRAGAPEDTIGAAIERLEALGVLDDRAYARHVARSRVLGGGVSKRTIEVELQRRGVARRVADEAITETLAEVELDEAGAARVVAEKRLRALRSYDVATRRKRLYAFLARRGYSPDVVARVIRELMGRGAAEFEGES